MQPICSDVASESTHVADVKVGRVKGNSRTYPQLRLPSRYADLAGATASIYDISGNEGDTMFIIRFGATKAVAAYHGASEPERRNEARRHEVPEKPCRGSDSGSNPDSGALLFGYKW